MKRHITLSLLLLALICGIKELRAQTINRAVPNVEISDTNGKPTTLPYFGSRHLIIFYIDPDRAGQNDEFTQELLSNGGMMGNRFAGISILNTKDAPMLPLKVAQRVAKKRSEQTNTPFFIDDNATLSVSWGLGDCNNTSTILIVSNAGELLFVCKGRVSDSDKAKFFEVVERIK